MARVLAGLLLAAVSMAVSDAQATQKDDTWLWQFVDDEKMDTMKLSPGEIARMLGGHGGEGEGEGEDALEEKETVDVSFSFKIEVDRTIQELRSDDVLVEELKKVGLKVLGLPLDKTGWISVLFTPSKTTDFMVSRRLSSAVKVEYVAHIPKESVTDVNLHKDPVALESDIRSAVANAEEKSSISYGIVLDTDSLATLTTDLESAWSDAVIAAGANASTPAPPAPSTPAPPPAQPPLEETPLTPTPTLPPTPTPTPAATTPTWAPTPPPSPSPAAAVQTPSPTQVEGFSSASVRSASGPWILVTMAIALSTVLKPSS